MAPNTKNNNNDSAPTVADALKTNAFFGGNKESHDHTQTQPPTDEEKPYTVDNKEPAVGEVLESNTFFHHSGDGETVKPVPEDNPKYDKEEPTVKAALQTNTFTKTE